LQGALGFGEIYFFFEENIYTQGIYVCVLDRGMPFPPRHAAVSVLVRIRRKGEAAQRSGKEEKCGYSPRYRIRGYICHHR
jgi:hypothetical protein